VLRMNVAKIPQPLLFNLLHALLLTLLLGNWWVHRNNHLFGNSNWIAGKDQGKFVFYTYDWMFRPLQRGTINLGQDQGFQELLFHQPEDAQNRLNSLECEVAMSDGTYIWFQFQKTEESRLGIRLTRTPRYPSGFFEFDPHGHLIEHTPFSSNEVLESADWARVRIEREDELYRLYVDDQLLGTHTYRGNDGHFGFRGAGRARGSILVRKVNMTFTDPGRPRRRWRVSEDFRPDPTSPSILMVGAGLALLFIPLRFLRTAALASLLPKERRQRFLTRDGIGFTILLGGTLALFNPSSGLHIPLAVVAGEVLGVVILLWLQDRKHRPAFSNPLLLSLAVGLVVLAGAAGMKQGETLGRSTRSFWNRMRNVDPNAIVLIPGNRPSTPYTLESPRNIPPGDPLFVPDRAYREQEILLEFTIEGKATLDILYQQQAFYTRGDVGGEELALQRRLLRLSTVPHTPQGISLGLRSQPAPFVKIEGTLHRDQLNTLRLRASGEGVEIDLNGTTSFLPGIESLGYGETGLMAYEPGVTVLRLNVSPLQSIVGTNLPLHGPSLPVLLGSFLILLLFLRIAAGYQGLHGVGFALLALYPLSLYHAGAVLLGPLSWEFLGAVRFVWLDACMVAGAAALLFPLAGFRSSIKHPPLYFNLVFLLLLAGGLLLTWDVLPEDHPLKVKLGATEAVSPGEIISDNRTDIGPWYANNRYIGANTYVWRQRFGPKIISLEKDPQTLRVFTIGGSQAWGSGAADSFSTFDALLEQRLQQKGYPVDFYNAGVNGAGISLARIHFDQILLQFQPDIVIADVGLNDSAALRQIRSQDALDRHRKLLFDALRSILETCERRNIQFILCLEAMSLEPPLRADEELYQGYVAIAEEFGVPVIDSREVINEAEINAMVWWDTAHLAPYGHHLLADILKPTVTTVVERLLDNRQ